MLLQKLQIADRIGAKVEQVKNVIIWGNHSSTQYPDVNHGTVDLPEGRVSIREAVKDDDWLNGDFIKVSSSKLIVFHFIVNGICMTHVCV